jgi:UPF0755 protein
VTYASKFDNTGGTYDFLPRDVVSVEGYLFPDTYRISREEKNASVVEDLTRKMLNNFAAKAVPVLDSADALDTVVKARHEYVIMASILEKEVQSYEDMQLVAGILWKRIERSMPLEADATVLYAVCAGLDNPKVRCDFSRIPVRDNLRIASAYNTYVNDGLPVGAISNPGRDALRAAANPKPSEYWFYLTARRDGYRTIFSKTLKEHNAARERYL